MTKVAVTVEADHLEKLTHPSRRLGGISELVWNALDAEADKVRVRVVENALEGVDVVEVIDNGRGITHADALHELQLLGGSWKRERRTSKNDKRAVHGSEGESRWRAFSIGDMVEWVSVAEVNGQREKISITGLHSTLKLAAGTSLPPGEDELELAGGLRGEPFRLVRGASVDMDVPADAEIVVEGYIPSGVRAPEGPFGDFLQFYVPEMANHRFRVTAITHRREPILQTMVAGSPEDVNLLGLSREVVLVEAVERTGAELVEARLGPTILGCTLAIRQRYAGEAKNVGLAALGAYGWLKYCVVVDEDVDVFDMDDVWWAVTTRSSPDRAIRVVEGAPAFPRDPHGVHAGAGGDRRDDPARRVAGVRAQAAARRPRLDLDEWTAAP